MDIIFSAGLPLIFYILSFLRADELMSKRKYDKDKRSSLVKKLLAVFCVEWVFFLTMCIVTRSNMMNDSHWLPPAAIALAGMLPFLFILVREFSDRPRTAKFLKRSAAAVLALYAAEVFVFNGKSLDSSPKSQYLDMSSLTLTGSAALSGDEIVLSAGGEIIIDDVPDYTRSLVVDVYRDTKEPALPFFVNLGMKDDDLYTNYEVIQQKYVSKQDTVFTMPLEPHGSIRSLKLGFSEVEGRVCIRSVRAVSAVPFQFSLLRFFVLASIAMLLSAVFSFQLWKVTYQRRKWQHKAAVGIMAVICAFSASLFIRPNEKAVEFDTEHVPVSDPYAVVADAFTKKQVWLDIEADPGLAELDNVYSRSERDESGYYALWDMAYYKGKYYCYFGAAPVLTYYLPYYKSTGKMPTTSMALGFYGVIAAFAMCMTILAAVRLTVPRPNLLLLLGSMPAALSCVGLFYAMNTTNAYDLPIVTGMCYLFLSLWTGLSAVSQKVRPLKLALLFISGAALALCAGSRPTLALSGVLLVPFFIGILRRKDLSPAFRIVQTLCFIVPLAVGGCAIMWYNNARFGSPLDFGAAYQLTVSDVRCNSLSLACLPPMIYHYLFQMPRPKGSFPFIENQFCTLYNYGRFIYTADITGVLAYPALLLGTFLLPASLRKKGRHYTCGISAVQRTSFILLCFVTAFTLCWLDFCLGGVAHRYVTDALPLMCIGAVICLLRGTGAPGKHIHRHAAAHIALSATFIMSWLLLIGDRNGNLLRHCTSLYDTCEDLLIFWM